GRVTAKAGTVAQRRQLCRRARVPCLEQRILDECGVRFVDLGNGKLRLHHDLDPQRREQAAKFTQLARIAGSENEARKGGHEFSGDLRAYAASAALWVAISSRIPRSARPTSAVNSPCVNGVFSAVPCSSTKPPAPVITTFMSVSHAESSA